MSEGYILDASAVLCLINGEPGAERVEAALSGGLMSAANLSEVVAKLSDLGLDRSEAEHLLASLNLTIEAFDTDAAYSAGSLRSETKSCGLSFADRACLALAQRRGRTALTADKAWSEAGRAIGVTVELVR